MCKILKYFIKTQAFYFIMSPCGWENPFPTFPDINSNLLYPHPPFRNFNSEQAIKSDSAYTFQKVV